MITYNKLILKIFLFLSIASLYSCIQAEKKTACSDNENFDSNTRTCVASASSSTLIGLATGLLLPITIYEDTPTTIYIPYVGSTATSCSVSDFGFLTAGACSCTAGICSFTLTPSIADYYGSVGTNYITYTLTNVNGTSAASSVGVSITAVDDRPVGVNNTTTTTEDTQTGVITLLYTDADLFGDIYYDLPNNGTTDCSISNLINLTVTSTCTCAAGTCTVKVTPNANLNTSNATFSFQYSIRTNTLWSDPKTITVTTVTPVDDAPVGSTSTVTLSENNSLNQASAGYTDTFIKLYYTDVDTLPSLATCTINLSGTGCSGATCIDASACTCHPTQNYCSVDLKPYMFLTDSTSLVTMPTIDFEYQINNGTASAWKTVTATISNSDDAPIVFHSNTTYSADNATIVTQNNYNSTINAPDAHFTASYLIYVDPTVVEDTATTISIPYIDPDGDSATMTVSNVTGGSAGATTCTRLADKRYGTCSFTYTPTANTNGVGSFTFTITANSETTTQRNVALTISAVDDAPTIAAPANQSGNMNTDIMVGVTVDEGGGTDEDAQTVTCTAVTVSGCSPSNFNYTGTCIDNDGDGDIEYIKLVPDTSEFGSCTVTATITDGTTSVTSSSFTATTNPVWATHFGWKHVRAVGSKVDSEGTTLASRSVRIEWDPFTISSSISGWYVYRRTAATDYTTPLNTTILPASQTYYVDTDTNLSASTTYFYIVRAVDNVFSKPTDVISTTADRELTVKMPENNMALIHRWSANREVCSKMALSYDRTNNYRCAYTGVGSDGTYYDIGDHYHMDIVEAGCNYTKSPACTSLGCIGHGLPTVDGCDGSTCTSNVNDNDIYYNRDSGKCYLRLAGTWQEMNSFPVPSTNYPSSTRPFNSSKVPPLLFVDQARSEALCQSRGASYHIPNRKIFIAASGWSNTLSDDTTAISDNSITLLETGGNLYTSTGCNSSSGSGLSYSSTIPTSTNFYEIDAIPGSISSPVRTVRTGSEATDECLSRYGIQDLVGNVREWSTENISCSGGFCSLSATGADGAAVPTGGAYAFDNGATGPCVDTNANGVCDGSGNFGDWMYETKLHLSSRFYIPYGLPGKSTSSTTGSLSITANPAPGSISYAQLHKDAIRLGTSSNFAGPPYGGLVNGGSYSDGTWSGRYTLEFLDTNGYDAYTGMRCYRVAP